MTTNFPPMLPPFHSSHIPSRDMDQKITEHAKIELTKKSNFKSAFFNKLTVVRNVTPKLSMGIKKTNKAFCDKLKSMKSFLLSLKKGDAAKKLSVESAADKDVIKDMLYNKLDKIVTPKSIIGSLLNDGNTITEHGQAIKNYLIENPESRLFSSDNMIFIDNKIVFIEPENIPGTEITIRELTFDDRDCRNGEFRGKVAMAVLRDAGIPFRNLDELCAIMTLNDKFNFVKQRTANMLATQFENPEVKKRLGTAENAEAIESFLTYDKDSDTYVSRFAIKTINSHSTPHVKAEADITMKNANPLSGEIKTDNAKPKVSPRPAWLGGTTVAPESDAVHKRGNEHAANPITQPALAKDTQQRVGVSTSNVKKLITRFETANSNGRPFKN